MKTFIIISFILIIALLITVNFSSKEDAVDILISWIITLLIIIGILIFGVGGRKDKESKSP
jgi:hypothetical protein